MREQIIERVLESKIIAIVRGVYGEDCLNLAKALCKGGIKLLEVTFDQSKPESLHKTSATVARITFSFVFGDTINCAPAFFAVR